MEWREREMLPLDRDRWRAEFPIERLGRYRYTLEGAIDHQKFWQHDFAKKSKLIRT